LAAPSSPTRSGSSRYSRTSSPNAFKFTEQAASGSR
jgi:hypothetical protein